MTIPTRDEAIRTLDEGHRGVRDLMALLSDDDLVEPATIGGGDWSAKDLLGHLTTWEEIALASLDEWRRGERPGIEDVFAIEAMTDEEWTGKAPYRALPGSGSEGRRLRRPGRRFTARAPSRPLFPAPPGVTAPGRTRWPASRSLAG